jgi:hypothetical protein
MKPETEQQRVERIRNDERHAHFHAFQLTGVLPGAAGKGPPPKNTTGTSDDGRKA